MTSIAEIVVAALFLLILVLCGGAAGVFSIDLKWIQPAVTFLGVIVALWLAIEQRFGAEVLRREDQRRLHDSHRAKLTFALSSTSAYANLCVSSLQNIIEENRNELGQISAVFRVPNLAPIQPNGEAIRDIAEAIASCSNRINARALSRLLHWMQIHASRTDALLARRGQTVSRPELAGSICDAACLGAMIGRAFPYARFQSETINVVLSSILVEGHLTFLRIQRNDPGFDAVFALIPEHVERINRISK